MLVCACTLTLTSDDDNCAHGGGGRLTDLLRVPKSTKLELVLETLLRAGS